MSMKFNSPEFAKAAESLNGRSANFNTATQRSTTTGMNDFNNSQRSAADTSNYALSSNPLVQRSMAEDSRNFTEDQRRFDKGLNFKDTADARANDTQRFGVSAQLEGNKYGVDGNIKQAEIGASASRYGADASVKATEVGANASKYGADRALDQARVGADASRFSALLGAGTATLNSQQYRPSFNR